MEQIRILIVDDEPNALSALKLGLNDPGYIIDTAETYYSALDFLLGNTYDILLADLKLPDGMGMDFLHYVRENNLLTKVVIFTAYSSVESALEAIKGGAFDYLVKPVRLTDLKRVVSRAADMVRLQKENEQLRKQLSLNQNKPVLIGNSVSFRNLIQTVRQIAPSKSTVLLLGENGTGKEVIAEAIHYYSNRAEQPLIKINCGAIPENLLESELFGYEKGAFTGAVRQKKGMIELAEGGTLFLDEIAELSPPLQVKLLRVLQNGEFQRLGGTTVQRCDIRFIAATNQDLVKLVEEKKFREDLYYRLNVIRIEIPPLRERIDDIPLLAYYFLNKYCQINQKEIDSISQDVIGCMKRYPWRGNIRELENMMERAVVFCRTKELGIESFPDLRDYLGAKTEKLQFEVGMSLEELEKKAIIQTLAYTKFDKTKAAKLLKIGTATLYRKLKTYNIPMKE
ncbi:MAG: sigma-54 dependent transcriptional regulator [Calditrichia bacterium]